MNGEKMMRAIGGISDRHIVEFAEVKPYAANRKAWIKYVTAAACICLICIAVFAVIQNRQVPAPPDDVTDRTADNYAALEVGSLSDASDGRIHKDEFPLWSYENRSYHFDESAPAEATVSFMGTEYTGSYYHSYTLIPDKSLRHVYKTGKIRFAIDSKTGKLKSISFYNEFDPIAVDVQYCKEIADSIISQYINISDYEVKSERSPYFALFVYTKTVDGYSTSDKAQITIDGRGNVISFGLSEINTFSEKDKTNVEKSVIEEAVKNKIDMIYGIQNICEYEIKDITLFLTPENKYAFLCRVSVLWEDGADGWTGCEEYFVIAPE